MSNGPQGWQGPPGGGQPGWGQQPQGGGQPGWQGPPGQGGHGGHGGPQGWPGQGGQGGQGGAPQGWQGPPGQGGPQGWQGPPGQGGPQGYQGGPQGYQGGPQGYQGGPQGFPGGLPGGGYQGGWQPPQKPLVQRPVFWVPLALVLIGLVVGGVLLFTGGDDEGDVVLDSTEGAAGAEGGEDGEVMVESVASAEPAAPEGESMEAMAGGLAEAMTDAMEEPAPETAVTEGDRPEPLASMPEAPPEPEPFEPADMPLPEEMADAAGGGGEVDALRQIAQPIAADATTEYQLAGEDVVVVSFQLAAGQLATVSAGGQQDPEMIIVAPDDTVVSQDSDSGPGLSALAAVPGAPVAGEYIAAVINNTGAAGPVSITLTVGVAEFELLDIPSDTVAPGDAVLYPVEVFAGESILVLVSSTQAPVVAGVAVNGEVVAASTEVAPNLHALLYEVTAEGTIQIVATAGDAGGDFTLYSTVGVSG